MVRIGRFGCVAVLVLMSAGGVRSQSLELIRNGSFDEDVDGWAQWFAPGQAAGRGVWEPRGDGGALSVDVTEAARLSSVQIYQGPFRVHADRWYTVYCELKAPSPTTVHLALMRHSPPYGILGLRAPIHVTPTWQGYSFLVRATADSEDARLDFFLTDSIDIDNVSVQELAGGPAAVPVSRIILGRGFHGDGSLLTDGDPATRVHAGGYPVLPVSVTLDLGAAAPVGAVFATFWDLGRHVSTDEVYCDVSADGLQWQQWARMTRTVSGNPNRARPALFSASGMGLTVRYVRLRVTRLKNTAALGEVEVYRAPSGNAHAYSALPAVVPEETVAFLGWDYRRNGYDYTPGEDIHLRFANQSESPVTTTVSYRLEDVVGVQTLSGRGDLSLAAGGEAAVPIPVPADHADGAHWIRFRVGEHGEEQSFHYDARVPSVPAGARRPYRLGAYFDCQEPEGWLRLMLGSVGTAAAVYRRVPDGVALDAVFASSPRWAADDEAVAEMRRYLASGGTLIWYGDIAPGVADLLPVVPEPGEPHRTSRCRLRAPAFWPGFDPSACPRQAAVAVRARHGSSVLAEWDDGTAAVVLGRALGGRVVYVAASSGRVWQRGSAERVDALALALLRHLVSDGAGVLRGVADRPGEAAVSSISDGSIGRFGWRIPESGLVTELNERGEMRCMAARSAWQLTIPGFESWAVRVQDLSWFAKEIVWSAKAGGAPVLSARLSLGSPLILWEGASTVVSVRAEYSAVLYAAQNGVEAVQAGDTVAGDALQAGWLVLLTAAETVRDAPRLVRLTRRPVSVTLSEGGLELRYGEHGFGRLLTGRLFGIRRFAPGETAAWVDGVPAAVKAQAESVSARALAYPVRLSEEFVCEDDGVVIENRTEHLMLADDWGGAAEVVTPLPPILSLFRRHATTVPEVSPEVLDTGVATKHGPLEVARGARVRYRLPTPVTAHYGVVPVADGMGLQDIIDTHARCSLDITRASGGLVTSNPFLEDLREYMSSSRFENPFHAPCIDLYKWWYCFPTVLGRPAISAALREEVDAHYRRAFAATLNYYAYKTPVRYRREPWSGRAYTVSFIWPVVWQDGVRNFVDQNESAAVIAYCLWAYAQYYGDWETVAANWHLMCWLYEYLPLIHDWALMASSNQSFFATVGIDMLNSEFPGHLAMARMARQVGDRGSEQRARCLAAKAMIPAVARLFMPEYVRGITAPGDPWRQWRYYWSLQASGFQGSESIVMRGDTSAILGLAIGMLDTSKGTSPEICALYRTSAPEHMQAYEEALRRAEDDHSEYARWARLMNRALLGWPRDELMARAQLAFARYGTWGWQSTKAPQNYAFVCVAGSGFHLVDWAPAAYVTGIQTADQASVTLRLGESRAAVVEAWSRRPVVRVRVDGNEAAGWRYDRVSGRVSVPVEGSGAVRVVFDMAGEPEAEASVYTPREAGSTR